MTLCDEKTHFIAGALVGATVNFTIQITQRAMDYDRPFDWSEFFLCTGAGAFAVNPKGIASIARPTFGSPGLRGTSYPGIHGPNVHNPERVAFSALCSLEADPETANPAIARQFFHTIISAALVAYALSGKPTLKLSRTTRLALWAFGISHLSHIALDSTTPKPINLI